MIELEPSNDNDVAVIREIYQRRQRVYEDLVTTAADDLHNDAINGVVVPAMMDLQTLMRTLTDPQAADRIQIIIHEQRRLVRILRSLAERLYLTGRS